MPTIFRNKGYRFFFYSNEGEPLELCHIHVRKGISVAKFWVSPFVSLENSYGFSPVELRKLAEVVGQNQKLIERKWNEYFSLD